LYIGLASLAIRINEEEHMILETTVNEPISSSIESEKSLTSLRNQLTTVVPTLNESESIGKLIDEITPSILPSLF
jgi:hypothetical protein